MAYLQSPKVFVEFNFNPCTDNVTISSAIYEDLLERMTLLDESNSVLDQASEVHKDSIIKQSDMGQGADGSTFEPLSEMYGAHKGAVTGRSTPDLRYGVGKPSALDVLDHEIYESDSSSFYFNGDPQMDEYMQEHQEGINGMPERRWFPDASRGDDNTPPQQANKDLVEQIIAEHFNEPRTINV